MLKERSPPLLLMLKVLDSPSWYGSYSFPHPEGSLSNDCTEKLVIGFARARTQNVEIFERMRFRILTA